MSITCPIRSLSQAKAARSGRASVRVMSPAAIRLATVSNWRIGVGM
ncbi:hypothetical protein [Tropicibacter oceani]|uniref:Uncharacterized protein n=1 Tax=Tropicibacter oceani TaxID=3058420 RepID=A0ABY8QHW7_9RHOB|nr:hypothetical protein [Tropicibacter oceani]WGW04120.1 hypothetical protein QF118_00855 [Tropicibacter oceani]